MASSSSLPSSTIHTTTSDTTPPPPPPPPPVSLFNRWTLEGNIYIVTGGTKGIGKAIVEELLLHHASTIIYCSRTFTIEDGRTKELYQQQYPHVTLIHITCDVGTQHGRQLLYDTIINHPYNIKEIHGLVNNVGVNVRKDIIHQTSDEYYNIMRTNIDSAYFLCQLLLPLLEYGVTKRRSYNNIHNNNTSSSSNTSSSYYYYTASIVNVSSAAGIQSSGTGIAYGMSKAAINQFTRTLACEWSHKGIRVNCIAPWMTITPMLFNAESSSSSSIPNTTTATTTATTTTTISSVTEKAIEWTPMHRLALPYEIAGPIIFLLMPISNYITGQIISVDGGLTCQGFAGPTTTTTTSTTMTT